MIPIKIKKGRYEKPEWQFNGMNVEDPINRILIELYDMSEKKILRLKILSISLFVSSAVLLIALIVIVRGMPK